MKKVTESSQNNMEANKIITSLDDPKKNPENLRICPSCQLMTIFGMPGGRDATCTNCGYKDPCCYD